MLMLNGALGGPIKVFVNLAETLALLPHDDLNNTLTLSPTLDAALLVNLTLITCEVTLPESIDAFAPKVPTKDHNHPVPPAVEFVAAGKSDAA
jgi:hypothetical protein